MTSLLQEYATRQADAAPDKTALAMGDERLSYGEIEQTSNRLAKLLQEVGCRPGDRVCLVAPKAPATIVSMLATLKAGCAYVPIDVASPAARIAKILAAADPRVILASRESAVLVDELAAIGALAAGVSIGTLDGGPFETERIHPQFSRDDAAAMSADPPALLGSADSAAHLLFTSGSTGDPKGVVITHANVTAFVEWAVDYFGITSSDRMSGHPPLHFDLSTFDIYGCFARGAELHLVPASANLVPHRLAQLIRGAALTQWFSVPSTMTYMAKFDVVKEGDFPHLKRVLWCGEVLPTPILIYWMTRLPHVQFTNLYGPTEATIASSYYTVPECPRNETDPIPIGTACAGEELLVLDEELRPVPAGEIGDLYIAGVGLSPGYWRDDEKTRAAFVQDPRLSDPERRIYRTGDLARVTDDGLVHFIGRVDSQIKSRGYRIELGEIEAALNALDSLRESAVVGVDTEGFEGTAICCAYAPATLDVEPAELRTRLQALLPAYMLPVRWLALEQLPKNVNGKIDRRRLRELFESEGGAPAGASTAEATGAEPVTHAPPA